jgi:class 3 adenylate cyclase
MNRPPASRRVRWRESFGAKVAAAVLGTVALLLATTLLIVRFETEQQIAEVVDDATERSRAAFAEVVALQEDRLSDVLNPITGSRRTVAALEAALDAGDPDLLRQEVDYGLDLVDAGEIALMLFTDVDGLPVLTVLDGQTLDTRDPTTLQSMIDHVVIGGFVGLTVFRLVDGRLYLIEIRALELGTRFIGTAAFGIRVEDAVADQLGRFAGGEVCLVADGRCVARSPETSDALGARLASTAGSNELVRSTIEGRRWAILSDPLNVDAPEDEWRVLAVDLDPVIRPFERISGALTLGGFVALLLAALASHFLSKGLAGPVRSLMNAAGRVAEGDYRVTVESNRKDELGRLADSFNEMTAGLRLKEQYRGVLDKVVSKDVAEELIEGGLELGGETRDVAVLFADIRGFTALTEGMAPEAVITLINACMEGMSGAVEAEGGVVDKYVGDELMAVFGAPVSRGDDAGRAVRAALRIQEGLAQLNEQRRAEGAEPIGVGVGVNAGRAVAGNMGSANRLNYTVLGEAVNLASRLCGLAPAGEIYVSEATAERVNGSIAVEPIGAHQLKGFSKECHVFRVRPGARV